MAVAQVSNGNSVAPMSTVSIIDRDPPPGQTPVKDIGSVIQSALKRTGFASVTRPREPNVEHVQKLSHRRSRLIDFGGLKGHMLEVF